MLYLDAQEITVRPLFNHFFQELSTVVQDKWACRAMVWRVLNFYLKVDQSDFILDRVVRITHDVRYTLLHAMVRLKQHEPIQYILGETYFAGHTFKVTPAVLIPRPETEEWVLFLCKHVAHPVSILDIGTGSGCIALSLKRHFPYASVDALDISEAALMLASQNAQRLAAMVNFIKMDILKEALPARKWSLMVSNPPYVGEKEKKTMLCNVLQYEPHLALFVDDADPLIFYKRIAYLAWYHLSPDGILCLEINEMFGKKVVDLLYGMFFKQVALHQDMQGKDRWVIALR